MDAPLKDPLVGQTLDGRYRVLARVAVGGMATVYRAMDTRLDRVLALKVMHLSLAGDQTFVERFIREAKSAARLAHPNIVAVYDQGTDGTYVYLAMEYIQGCTLRDLLVQRGALQPRAVLDVLEPVLAALGSAHRAGLIHRDVKPENVLIGDDGRVKVADFGLVRAVDSQTSTDTTSVMGTVSYLAPEQIEHGTAGTASDVYACGVMLFEALTGSKPHGGGTPAQVLYQHLHRGVPAPSSRVPTLPRVLDALVLRATDRDPAARPADAVELLHEVREARAALSDSELDTEPETALPGAVASVDDSEATDRHRQDDDTAVLSRRVPAGQNLPHSGSGARSGAEGGTDREREHTSFLPPLPSLAPTVDPEPQDRGPGGRWSRIGRSRRALAAIVGAVVLVLVLGAGVWYINSGQFTQTPSVLRLTQAQAEQKLDEAGLRVKVSRAHHATVDRGRVVATDPTPGSRIRGNGTVTITVSRGPEVVKVPQLKGVPLAEARKRLKSANLAAATVTREFSDTVDRGAVVATDPKAGSERRPGSAVSLVVSKGEQLDVPSVTGMTEEEAREELTEVGFEVKVASARVHSEEDSGTVARQSPDEGATGATGDTVTLTLSKGPEMVEVPDVVGMDEDEAVQELEDAGFKVTVRRFFFTGKVFNQSVDAGEDAPKGSKVTVYIR
ncbi:Stk1 family PASTA domain-containing Ser/Thr kinase [Streptomyces sp. XM4193]|uniref:Stk1 family PASTA domain-containing Ser/Thr kinase n=1 Tax=Streptomyces sp. XM4193 TaxID=2929782 RepID=UPI001FF73CB6|nr:Stk1 family PASTA domain-containing Ser/Thr kinase [Streptomyces sp. XM4193]MCK1796337.1 Stk1 family PASTA domain-containing Ser/Thr kinase [Streptomyces sp. XM4193]